MAISRLLFCAASLALLDLETAASDTGPKLEFQEKDVNGCLSTINAARKEAGLGDLTPKDSLFSGAEYNDQGLGQAIFETVLKGAPSGTVSGAQAYNGTYAVFALGESSDPGCSAAVTSWQSGFSLFGQNAPSKDTVDIKKPQAVSFLTLYNPYATNGYCKVADCTPQATEGSKKSALVCVTDPSVIGKDPMYTADQWEKIVKVFSSSASTAVPSLLAIAAVLAGVSLL
ncbi:hypothetical protein Emed_002085 [Eimeria media]